MRSNGGLRPTSNAPPSVGEQPEGMKELPLSLHTETQPGAQGECGWP